LRLRLFGTICREPGGVPVTDLELRPADRKALAKLIGAGLVQRTGDRFVVRPETFSQAARDFQAGEHWPRVAGGACVAGGADVDGGADGSASDRAGGASERVAALFSRGRLSSMPRPGALRTELLQWLAERFEPGRTYGEPDIRRKLEPIYADHVALRRYLVDEDLLERDNYGSYWRPAAAPG
jgi:hypothetical protein